jgi:hypothetical protein
MEKKSIEVNEESPVKEKKMYTPPSLNIYGKLTELTASGSMIGMEVGSMTLTEMA